MATSSLASPPIPTVPLDLYEACDAALTLCDEQLKLREQIIQTQGQKIVVLEEELEESKGDSTMITVLKVVGLVGLGFLAGMAVAK